MAAVEINVELAVDGADRVNKLVNNIKGAVGELHELMEKTTDKGRIRIDVMELAELEKKLERLERVARQIRKAMASDNASMKLDLEDDTKEIENRLERAFQEALSKIDDKFEMSGKEAARAFNRTVDIDMSNLGGGGSGMSDARKGVAAQAGDEDFEKEAQRGAKAVNRFNNRAEKLQQTLREMSGQDGVVNREDLERSENALRQVYRQLRKVDEVRGQIRAQASAGMISDEDAEQQMQSVVQTTRKLRGALQDTEGDIKENIRQFNRYSEAKQEVRGLENRIDALVNKNKELMNSQASTMDEMARQGKVAQNVTSEYREVRDAIDQVQQQLRIAREQYGQNSDEVARFERRLAELQDKLENNVGATKQGRAALSTMAQTFDESGASVQKLELRVDDLNQSYARAMKLFKEGNAGIAANKFRNIGKQASTLESRISRLIQGYERLERSEIGLNDQQEKTLMNLRRMQGEMTQVNQKIRSQRNGLKRLETQQRMAGNAMDQYNAQLADGVVNNFRFINAMSLVTAAIFGVQQAFMEILQESESFGKVLTVLESKTMSLQRAFDQTTEAIRTTAVEFGARVEEVSEVVFQLGSAGLTAEEAMAGLRQTMKLLVGTQGDAQSATKSVAGMYNVFADSMVELETRQAKFARITDTLTKIYQNHQVELEEMTQGLKFVAATGKNAGFQFQELAGFLAVLNDNMIKSGQAGRTLQRVLSQFAKKRNVFKDAFNVELDENSPLNEQFLDTLKQVNRQMDGALNLEQLGTQFDVFGLRGAKAFATLVENVEDVEGVLNNLEENAQGAANEVAQIAKGTLQNRFQQAKQALFELVRGGLEPTKEALKVFAETIKQVQEFLEWTQLDHLITNLTIFGGVLVVVYQSVSALTKVFGGLIASVIPSISAFSALTGQEKANAAAAQQNSMEHYEMGSAMGYAAATGRWLDASLDGVAASGNAATTSTLALGTAINTAFAYIPQILGLLTTFVAGWQYFSQTTREVKENIGSLLNEFNKIDRSIGKIEKLQSQLDELTVSLRANEVATAAAAKNLRETLSESSVRLVDKNKILAKSNNELAGSISKINEKLQRQLEKRKALQQMRLERKQEEAIEKVMGNDVTGVEGLSDKLEDQMSKKNLPFPDTGTFFNISESGTDLGGAFLKMEETVNRARNSSASMLEILQDVEEQSYKVNVIGGRDRIAENRSIDFDERTLPEQSLGVFRGMKQTMENVEGGRQEQLEVAKEFLEEIQTTVFGTVEDSYLKARGVLTDADIPEDRVNRLMDDYLRNSVESTFGENKISEQIIKRMEEQLNNNVQFEGLQLPSDQLIDVGRETLGVVDRLRENLDAPIKTNEWAKFLGRMKGLNDELTDTNNKWNEYQERISNIQTLQRKLAERQLDLRPGQAQEVQAALQEEMESLNNLNIDFETETISEVIKSQVVSSVEDGSQDAQAIMENLTEYAERTVGPQLADELGGKGVRKSIDVLVKDLARVNGAIDEEKLLNLVERLTESFGESGDAVNRVMEALKDKQINKELEQRNEYVRDFLEANERAIERQASLNEFIQKENEYRKTSRQIQLRRAQGFGVEEQLREIQQRQLDTTVNNPFEDSNSEGQREQPSELEEMTTFGGAMERDLEATENLGEQIDMLAKMKRQRQEILVYVTKHENKLSEMRLEQQQIEQSLEGSVAQRSQEAELQDMQLQNTIQQLEVSQSLTDDRRESLKAVQKLRELQSEQLEGVQELADARREDTQTATEVLTNAEEILHADKERAGVQYELLGAARRIQYVKDEIARATKLQEEGEISVAEEQSHKINLYNEYIDALNTVSDIKDDIEKKEENIVEAVDRRLSTLRRIKDAVSAEAEELGSSLSTAFEDAFDRDMLGMANQVGGILGLSQGQVLANESAAIERIVSLIKQGAVSADQFGGRIGFAANQLQKYTSETRKFDQQIKQLGREQLAAQWQGFHEALDAGNIDEAASQLDRAKQTIQDIYSGREDREQLVQAMGVAMDAEQQLADARANAVDEMYNIEVKVKNQDKIVKLFELMKDSTKTVKEQMASILGLSGDVGSTLDEAVASFKGEGEDILRNEEGQESIVKVRETLQKNADAVQGEINALNRNTRELRATESAIREWAATVSMQTKNASLPLPLELPSSMIERIVQSMTDIEGREPFKPANIRETLNQNLKPLLTQLGDLESFNSEKIIAATMAQAMETSPGDAITTFQSARNAVKTRMGEEQFKKMLEQNSVQVQRDILEQMIQTASRYGNEGRLQKILTNQSLSFGGTGTTGSKQADAVSKLLEQMQSKGVKVRADKTFKTALTDAVERGVNRALGGDGENKPPTQNRRTGGKIDGYGGGDIVPAMLEPGEYVIPKEAAKSIGPAGLSMLRQGKLPGYKKGGFVQRFGGSEIGNISPEVTNKLNKTGRELIEQGEDLADFRERRSQADIGAQVLKQVGLQKIVKEFVKSFESGLDRLKGTVGSFFDSFYVPKFAEANAEAFEQYEDRMEDIEEQYERQFDQVEDGLKRNESTYYDYLNAAIDAQKQRAQSVVDAQRQYREQLKQTREVIESQFEGIFSQTFSKQNMGSVLGIGMDKIFGGSLQTQANEFAASIANIGNERGQRRLPENYLTSDQKSQLRNALQSGKGDKAVQMMNKWTESMKSANNSTSLFKQVMTAGQQSADLFLNAIGRATLKITEFVGQGISKLAKMAADEDADDLVKFIEKFVNELPQKMQEFVNDFGKHFQDIITTIADSLPEIANEFVKALPEALNSIVNGLAEALPKIVQTLANNLPKIVSQIVPKLADILVLLIEQLPTILGSLAESLSTAITKIAKKLPSILTGLVEAIVKGIVEIIKGLFKGGPLGAIVGLFVAFKLGSKVFKGATKLFGKAAGLFNKGVSLFKKSSGEMNKAGKVLKQAGQQIKQWFRQGKASVGSGRKSVNKAKGMAPKNAPWKKEAMKSIDDTVPAYDVGNKKNKGPINPIPGLNVPSTRQAGDMASKAQAGKMMKKGADAATKAASASKDAVGLFGKIATAGTSAVASIGQLIAGINTKINKQASKAKQKRQKKKKTGGILGGILGGLGAIGGFFLGGPGGAMAGFSAGSAIGQTVPRLFHDGGVIKGGAGPKKETLITAQSGEGVVSRKGMKAIGGARGLAAINRGRPPKAYHSGGVVGKSYMDPHARKSSTANRAGKVENKQVNNNNVNVEYKSSPGESPRQARKNGREFVKGVDEELARMTKDRKSEFADELDKK